MIAIITIIVLSIMIGIISIIRMNKRIKRTNELEVRLTEYYIQREQRLKDNVSIEDIKGIESELNIVLTNAERKSILKEYDRIVWDSCKDWDILIRELINKR